MIVSRNNSVLGFFIFYSVVLWQLNFAEKRLLRNAFRAPTRPQLPRPVVRRVWVARVCDARASGAVAITGGRAGLYTIARRAEIYLFTGRQGSAVFLAFGGRGAYFRAFVFRHVFITKIKKKPDARKGCGGLHGS